jgi:hypothetical protein
VQCKTFHETIREEVKERGEREKVRRDYQRREGREVPKKKSEVKRREAIKSPRREKYRWGKKRIGRIKSSSLIIERVYWSFKPPLQPHHQHPPPHPRIPHPQQ